MLLERCPRCGSAWRTCIALSGAESEFWKECSNPKCNSYYNSYVPQQHQYEFHRDCHRFTGNFGGF